jgi:hypothetical protein
MDGLNSSTAGEGGNGSSKVCERNASQTLAFRLLCRAGRPTDLLTALTIAHINFASAFLQWFQ